MSVEKKIAEMIDIYRLPIYYIDNRYIEYLYIGYINVVKCSRCMEQRKERNNLWQSISH